MPKKEETPLQLLQKETETLQKKVSGFDKECSTFFKKSKDDTVRKKELYNSCQEFQEELQEIVDKLEELDAEDENMKENKFVSKKKDETKKFKTIEDKLNKLEEKLKPEDDEEDVEEEEEEEEEVGSEEEEEDSGEEEESEEEEEEGSEEEEEGSEDETEEDSEETDIKRPFEAKSVAKKPIEAKSVVKTKAGVPAAKGKPVKDAGKQSSASVAKSAKNEETEDEETETETETEEDDEEDDEEYTDEEEEEEEEDDDEEETDEDDSEDETEEDTDLEKTSTMRQYIALDDFTGEEDGDLSFKKGDILTVIAARSDGWLEAEDNAGKRGLVPITYLQVYNKYAEQDKDSEDDEEDEDQEEEATSSRTPRSGRDLWRGLMASVKETSATDVLHAFGAMPAGFRPSTLAKLHKQDKYSIHCFLMPKLSPSCVSFRDLFLDKNSDLLRPRQVRVQKILTIIQGRQIPLPGTGAEVVSRHVRVCLFDGQNVLSNIHTIKISGLDKEQKTWNFNNKVADCKKSIEYGEIFIRTNSSDANIGVLVELCVTIKRTSSNMEGELSCGWVHFKLFDPDGKPVAYKTYDEFVHGGTIYEQGVDVDPSVGKKAASSKFRSLMAGNKQPRLILRIAEPTKEQKVYLDALPDVLISATPYISYIAFYRQILADLLLRDRPDLQSSELIYSPLLATLPDVIEQADLMDLLRACWADELKIMKRTDRKDVTLLKEKFQQVYLVNIYPLTICASMPPWDFVHEDLIKKRFDEIKRISGLGKGNRVIALSLLSPDVEYRPLDLTAVSFDIVNPHCTVKSHGI